MPESAAAPSSKSLEFEGDLKTLLHAQRTELLTHLTGAIAHQFNNIMMAVTSYAELELKKAAPPERRSLEQVLSHAARATSLVQQLLAFSRKQTPAPQSLSVNAVITATAGLLQNLVGEDIEIKFNLNSNIQLINADPVEVEQIVLSLALNSRDAMAGEGKLTIATDLVDLDEKVASENEGAQPGQYVMLSVSDTGTKSSSPKRNRASGEDPRPDLRVNLALAAVRGIVKEARGLIRISSTPAKGSSFKIYLPTLGLAVPQQIGPGGSPNIITSAKTILVVEDDDAVRVPAAEFLKMEGFKVLQAKSGPEALNMVERYRAPIDLLITDVVMPEMSGPEVARKLLQLYAGLKVLYMSGDAGQAPASSDLGISSHILQKPFRLNKLNDEIHDLLQR